MALKTDRLLSKAKKLVKKGKVNEAQEIYSNILKSTPNNREANEEMLSLSKQKPNKPTQEQIDTIMNLYSMSQFEEAQINVRKLIDIYPKIPLLFNISGACYTEMGMIEAAIDSFENAIFLKPDYAEAFYNLGVAFQKLQKLDKAIQNYEKALNIKHAYPTAHNNLGLILFSLQKYELSLKYFEWAIAYSPEYAEAYNNLGIVQKELKMFEKSLVQFKKAVSLNPNYAQAFFNLGITLEILGFKDYAIENYEKAIFYNKNFIDAYRDLSRVKKFTKNDPLIEQIKSIYLDKNLSISNKSKICFTLAKVNEDIGNQKEFFKFLNEGNQLRKKELNYSIKNSKRFQSSMLKLFKSPLPKFEHPVNNNSAIQPIFIVGMPRSGTSLLEQIISSHNKVFGAGELEYMRDIISPIFENYITSNKKKIQKDDLLLIRQKYLDSLSSLNINENIIIDKMPLNFRLIGFIFASFPEAKIIHIKRDAIATCWSNYKHYFPKGNGFTHSYNDLVEYYSLYIELMDYWHKLFPNKIYDISYEKLTKNQIQETKNLLKYCDLKWDENCLNFHHNKRPVLTASSSQVRQNIYQGSSDIWKKYESYIEPLVNGLDGY